MAVSIVRTQSTKWLALAVGPGGDDVSDLDGAISDDHAVNQQFEQRPLLIEVGACQALAHTATERLGVGCQASRLALAFGIMRELEFLPVQRLQPCLGVAAAALVFGQRHDASQIGVREPLDLLAESRPTAAQVGSARLQLLRQPVAAARPRHRVRDHLRRGGHLAQVAPYQVVQGASRDVARRAVASPHRVIQVKS